MRYAAVEELRKYLPNNPASIKEKVPYIPQSTHEETYTQHHAMYARQQIEFLNQRILSNINQGVEARRTYGGCSGSGGFEDGDKVSRDLLTDVVSLFGQIDAVDESPEDDSSAEDQYGSLVFYCTEGHRNTRERNELKTECVEPGCKGQVCAPKDEESKSEDAKVIDLFSKNRKVNKNKLEKVA